MVIQFAVSRQREFEADRVGALIAVGGAFAWAAGSLYSRGATLPKRDPVDQRIVTSVRTG